MAQQNLRSFDIPKHHDVNQRTITELVYGIHIRSAVRKKIYSINETLDGQKMNDCFAVNPPRINQLRLRRQQVLCAITILDYGVDEFSNQLFGMLTMFDAG